MPQPLPKADPDVKVPAAVRAAAARADELLRSTTEIPEPAPDPAITPDLLPTPAPEVTSQGNDPAPTPVAANDNWEHRYNSMKGRYDGSKARIRQLEELVSTLQSGPVPTPTPAHITTNRLITPEEETEYGPEFLSVVGKKAREELAPVVADVADKINRLQTSMKLTAKQTMHAVLDDTISNWRDINKSPEFLDWLDLPDTYSGATRISLLQAAYEQNDTPRVLAFFRGFLTEEAAHVPATGDPAPALEHPTPAARVPLIELAAPGRAKSAATIVPAEKPIFTRTQIARFYTDVAAGRYRGRDEEKNKLEKQIFEAQAEGRIR